MITRSQDVQIEKAMNLDTHEALLSEGDLVYMLNGDVAGYENGATDKFVQNVLGNSLCYKFPTGYEFKGSVKLDREEFVLFFKTENSSEIGLFNSDNCTYVTLVNNTCFNFENKIRGVFKNKPGCDKRRVYFVEPGNKIRKIDVDECQPVRNIADCHDCTKDEVFDCDAYNLHPSISFPVVDFKKASGNLPNGCYQVAIAGTDKGQRFTEYHVYPQVLKFHTNNQANNTFGIEVDFVDCPKGYDEYELVLIAHRTDRATLAQRIGYFNVEQTSVFISELDDPTYIPVALQLVYERYPRYQSADFIATNNETLVLGSVSVREAPNYQPRANLIKSNWVVKQVRAKDAHKHFSYMRGETYAHFIRGVHNDGEVTPWYHVRSDAEYKIKTHQPALWPTLFDNITDADNCEAADVCAPVTVKRWELYDSSRVYFTDVDVEDTCDGKVIMRGDFGYWQSTLNYPNETCVWQQRGTREEPDFDAYGLACQPVQYHRFPDNKVTHIHNDKICGGEDMAYILGIEFSNIPTFLDKNNQPIADIVGFEIGVADRSNHKSIIHKGLIYNMFEEKLADCTTSYYPNYPFNDLRPDVFLSTTPAQYGGNGRFDEIFFNPVTTYSQDRFQYISPDVQYERNDSGSYLQIYAEQNGVIEGRYSPTEGMPWNVILSDLALITTGVMGIALAITLNQSFYSAVDGITTVLQSLRNGLAPVNYAMNYFVKSFYRGYNFNNVVPGNIRRKIVQSQYLLPSKMLVGGDKVNNFQREQGLFLKLCSALTDPFVDEYSRIRYSDTDCDPTFEQCQVINGILPRTSSYYAGIKVNRPSQYGFPDSNIVKPVTNVVPWTNISATSVSEVFGGDIHITKHKYIRKMPFFTQLPFGLPTDTQYKTRPYMNVWNTRYWLDINEQTSFMAVGNLSANDARNLEPTSNLRKKFCEVEGDDCGQDLFFRVDGKYYTHVVGEAEYWCESPYIGDFREYNEIPESDVERDFTQKISYRTVQYPELFLYNQQYRWNGLTNFGIHSDINRDCCKPEVPCYKNTLVYSLKHDPLSKGDAYLKFLPSAMQQFSGKDGRFIGLKELDENNLLIVFEDAMYTTQQDEYLNSDNGRIFLGSPDLFSRRLKKISEDVSGFGGCIDIDSIQVTRYGVFAFDRKRKKFLTLGTNGLQDITGDMQGWFNKNLEGEIIGVYDNYTNRIHFTGTGANGCKWTLRFRPDKRQWVSFASFTPVDYFPVSNNYLSNNGEGIWKHNDKYKYQTYYGTKYPFEVGFVVKDKLQQLVLSDFQIYSEWVKFTDYDCKVYNPSLFFNKMLIYNQLYSTGVKTIQVKDKGNAQHYLVQNRTDLIECTPMEDFTYRLNKFDAARITNSRSCGECMSYTIPTTVGDEVPIRGKWFKVHLINDEVHDHKITLQLTTAQHEQVSQ